MVSSLFPLVLSSLLVWSASSSTVSPVDLGLLADSVIPITPSTPILADPAPQQNAALYPVDPSHPLRSNNPLAFVPSKDITLHYAEDAYESASHYGGSIDWTLADPALVIADHEEIVSIKCGSNGVTVVYDSAASYKLALKWPTPLVFIVEGDQVHTHFFISLVFSLHRFFSGDRRREEYVTSLFRH